MNSLSWLLYFADMAQAVDFALATLSVGCVLTFIICGLVYMVNDWGSESDKRHRKGALAAAVIAMKVSLGVFVADIVFPSKGTLYAIAASEYGEEALKTPEATKARAALNAWLDKQIGEQQQPEKAK